jgi:hypothetical protein
VLDRDRVQLALEVVLLALFAFVLAVTFTAVVHRALQQRRGGLT